MSGDSDHITPGDHHEQGGFDDIFRLPDHIQSIVDDLRKGAKIDEIPALCQKDDGNDDIGQYPGSVGEWNVIPGVMKVGCRKNLIVLIDDRANILDCIWDAYKLVTIKCQNITETVLFYVSVDNAHYWWAEWDRLSPNFAAVEKTLGLSIYVQFQISINWRAMLSLKFRDAPSGRRAECRKLLHSFGPTVRRALLIDILEFATERLGETDKQATLVDGYRTEQPVGCNRVPVLVFGNLGSSRMLPHTWVLRITLEGPVRVILPYLIGPDQEQLISPRRENDGTVYFGTNGSGVALSFSPKSTEDFRIEPNDYFSSRGYP